MDEDFNYDDLVNARDSEASSKQICDIPSDFYDDLREYMQELEERVSKIAFPHNKKEKFLYKEYKQVKKLADDFFKKRQKKIVLAAYHHSLGESVNTGNMLEREIELYKDISNLLQELKEEIFFGGYKRKGDGKKKIEKQPEKIKKKDEVTEPGTKVPEEKSPMDEEKVEPDKDKKDSEAVDTQDSFSEDVGSHDEVLVHVTEDIPPFIDLETSYELKKEDVVTLREDIANVLIERGKARKIKL
ncbi:MAG: hypothetical protein ACOC5D_00960 [Thermoplasmatota archaeon]